MSKTNANQLHRPALSFLFASTKIQFTLALNKQLRSIAMHYSKLGCEKRSMLYRVLNRILNQLTIFRMDSFEELIFLITLSLYVKDLAGPERRIPLRCSLSPIPIHQPRQRIKQCRVALGS